MENLLDFLKLLARRIGIGLVCALIIVLCANELDVRGLFAANPLKTTPLHSVTLKNLFAGPKTWQQLGWFKWSLPNKKTLSEAAAKLPAPILKLVGQASPSGALSATFSTSVASGSTATQSSISTHSAALSTASADLVSPEQWQKLHSELGQVWERAKTAAGALQTFIKTQLFAPAPTPSSQSNSSATATVAPLEQRAIEYAKYLYCKETVSAYEKLNPGVVAPSPIK